MESKTYTENEVIQMLDAALKLALCTKPVLTVPIVIQSMKKIMSAVERSK